MFFLLKDHFSSQIKTSHLVFWNMFWSVCSYKTFQQKCDYNADKQMDELRNIRKCKEMFV